jgi:heme-degrading monooxygenase HmoA
MAKRVARARAKTTTRKTKTDTPKGGARNTATQVVRIWSARATPAGAKKYVSHFRRTVLPQLQRLRGYRGALLLRRREHQEMEIQVLTFWKSLAAIRQFAGADVAKAVVEDEARAVLKNFDLRVAHFALVLDTQNPRRV